MYTLVCAFVLVRYEHAFLFSSVVAVDNTLYYCFNAQLRRNTQCASTINYKSELVRSVSVNVTAALEVKQSHVLIRVSRHEEWQLEAPGDILCDSDCCQQSGVDNNSIFKTSAG